MAQPFDNSTPNFISTKEAGWLFNRSDATIRRWCHTGKLRYRQVGKDIDVNFQHAVEVAQITVEDTLAIINQRRKQEQGPPTSTSEGDSISPGQLRHTTAFQVV